MASSVSIFARIRAVLSQSDLKSTKEKLDQTFNKGRSSFFNSMKLSAVGLGATLGVALKNAITGALDPLKTVEDKIRSIVDESKSISELASQFETSPETIAKLQSVAQAKGLSKDELNKMMQAFLSSVNGARMTLATGGELKDKEKLVSQFINEKDMGEAFIKLMSSLQRSGSRDLQEQALFGAKTFGSARTFMSTKNINEEARHSGFKSANFRRSQETFERNRKKDNVIQAKQHNDIFTKAGSDKVLGELRRKDSGAFNDAIKEIGDFTKYEGLYKNVQDISESISGLWDTVKGGIKDVLSPASAERTREVIRGSQEQSTLRRRVSRGRGRDI